MSHEQVRFVPFHEGVVFVSYLVSEKIRKTASRSLMILTRKKEMVTSVPIQQICLV